MKLVHFNVLAILGVFTSACYGCETNPTYPTPISVAGSPGAAGAAASAAGNPSGGVIGLAGAEGKGGSPSNGGSGGSASPGPCALACARLASLGCEAAKPSEGVTCEALCEEIPTLKASAACVVRATSCSRADACSSEAAP